MDVISEIMASGSEWLPKLEAERQRLMKAIEEVDRAIGVVSQFNKLLLGSAPVMTPPETQSSLEFDRNAAEREAKVIIQEADSQGIRPREITLALRERGFAVNDQFASNLVWKLTNRTKETIGYKGQYYWRDLEPSEAKQQGATEVTP